MAHRFNQCNIQIPLLGILWGNVGSQTADVPGLPGFLQGHCRKTPNPSLLCPGTRSSVPGIIFKAGGQLRRQMAG